MEVESIDFIKLKGGIVVKYRLCYFFSKLIKRRIIYDIIVSKLRTIKLNLSINDYKFNCSENQPDSLDSMLEYIDKNIILIQYPVAENDSEFHSFYLWHEAIPKPVIFINTNEYVDNQYFYLAHELYHHFYKDGDEKKADKYAAQLLIPD